MKKILAIVILALSTLSLSACSSTLNTSTANKEQVLIENNQRKLLEIQPPVSLNWSLERENINKRTSLWNDPNKISYIYLINYGKVIAFYTIKGKVSSVNSQITNPEALSTRWTGGNESVSGHYIDGVIPSPAEDGSYGTNGDAIFFFDTNGTYYEWAGDYLLVDQPMKLSTPPEIVREIK